MKINKNKMKVEIWSDMTCPFCYIGKRKLESALLHFKNAGDIEIHWKSFELAPGFKTDPTQNMHQFLAKLKGISLEQSVGACDQLADAAKQEGLTYNFHKVIPANSFNAHRLSHLAKHHNLQDQAKEVLLTAYFTEGKNIDDISTLTSLGAKIGLDPTEVKGVLQGSRYTDEVNQDIADAKHRGITSIPAFLFDDKLTVSGAQDSKSFLGMLEKTFAEWEEKHGSSEIGTDGQSCSVDGGCK